MYSIKYFRLAAKFSGHTAIDLYELFNVLKNLGYMLMAPLPPRGFKSFVPALGPVASKGGIVVDANSERQVIGVSAPDPEICMYEFVAIEKAVLENIQSLRGVEFYELLTEIEIDVSSNADVFRALKKLSPRNPLVEAVSRAFNENLYVFSYRFTAENMSPEEPEWMDLEVIPSPSKPRRAVYISIAYRSRNREKVFEKIRSIKLLAEAVNKVFTETGKE